MRCSVPGLFSLVMLTLLLSGCARQKAHPAVAAYDSMMMSMLSGKMDAFVEMLSQRSRNTLCKRLDLPPSVDNAALARAIGIKSHWRFEQDLLSKTKLIEKAGDENRKLVEVKVAGRAWEIPVVRHQGNWRVDLFHGKPSGSPDGD